MHHFLSIVGVRRTAVVSALLAVSPMLCSCDYFAPPLLKECEEVVKSRLLSPSGYKRISYEEVTEEISIDDFINFERSQDPTKQLKYFLADRRKMQNEKIVPKKFNMILEFDAPNSFNALVRDKALCEYYSRDGEMDTVFASDLVVDGDSLIDRIKKGVFGGL